MERKMRKKIDSRKNTKKIIFDYIYEYTEENNSVKNSPDRNLELVKKYANKLKSDIKESKRMQNDYPLYLNDIISECYKYIEKHIGEKILDKDDQNGLLVLKYKSVLQSFDDIIHLMQLKDFSNSLVLFRVLYENMVILQFLLKNPDCIGEFEDYSLIKLIKIHEVYGTKTEMLTESIRRRTYKVTKISENKYQINSRDVEMESNKNYDWAKGKIKKDKGMIGFHDIEAEVLKYNSLSGEDDVDLRKKNMAKIYSVLSDLTHANTSILSHPETNDVLCDFLFFCFMQIGFPLIVTNFLDLFKYVYNGKYLFQVKAFEQLLYFLIYKNDKL